MRRPTLDDYDALCKDLGHVPSMEERQRVADAIPGGEEEDRRRRAVGCRSGGVVEADTAVALDPMTKLDDFLAMIGRTVGGARLIERDLGPKIRRAALSKMGEMERIADETEQSLRRQMYERAGETTRGIANQGKAKNDQRRVRRRSTGHGAGSGE
jgi:hypothetical protein